MNAAPKTPESHDAMQRQALRRLLEAGKSWLLNDAELDGVLDMLMAYQKTLSLQSKESSWDDTEALTQTPLLANKGIPAMHPEQIKAQLRMKGFTLSGLAHELGLSHCTVSQVVRGTSISNRIRASIAEILGMPIDALWPPSKAQPVLPRSLRTEKKRRQS